MRASTFALATAALTTASGFRRPALVAWLRAPSAPPRARCAALAALPPHLAQAQAEVAAGDAVLLDVRELGEWSQGRLADARLAPLSDLVVGVAPPVEDKSTKLYVHCAAGVRVHKAAPILRDMGFERVVPLQEGFGELAMIGFSKPILEEQEPQAPW